MRILAGLVLGLSLAVWGSVGVGQPYGDPFCFPIVVGFNQDATAFALQEICDENVSDLGYSSTITIVDINKDKIISKYEFVNEDYCEQPQERCTANYASKAVRKKAQLEKNGYWLTNYILMSAQPALNYKNIPPILNLEDSILPLRENQVTVQNILVKRPIEDRCEGAYRLFNDLDEGLSVGYRIKFNNIVLYEDKRIPKSRGNFGCNLEGYGLDSLYCPAKNYWSGIADRCVALIAVASFGFEGIILTWLVHPIILNKNQ